MNPRFQVSHTSDWRDAIRKLSEKHRVHNPNTGKWEVQAQTLEDMMVFMSNEASSVLDDVRERWNRACDEGGDAGEDETGGLA